MRRKYLERSGLFLFACFGLLSLFHSCQNANKDMSDVTGGNTYPIYVVTRVQEDVKENKPTYNEANTDTKNHEDALRDWYFLMAQEESHQIFQVLEGQGSNVDIRDHSSVQNYRLLLFGNAKNRKRYNVSSSKEDGTFDFSPKDVFSDNPQGSSSQIPSRIYSDYFFAVPQSGVLPPFLMGLKSKLPTSDSNQPNDPTDPQANESVGFYRAVFKKEASGTWRLYREMNNEGIYDSSLNHFELVRLANKLTLESVIIQYDQESINADNTTKPETPYSFGMTSYKVDSIYFEDVPKYYSLDKDHMHPLYESEGKYFSYPKDRKDIWDHYSVVSGETITNEELDQDPDENPNSVSTRIGPGLTAKYFVSRIKARSSSSGDQEISEGVFYLPPLNNDFNPETNPLLVDPKLVIVIGKYILKDKKGNLKKIEDRKVSIRILRDKALKKYYNRHLRFKIRFNSPWESPLIEFMTAYYKQESTSVLYTFGDFNLSLLVRDGDDKNYYNSESKDHLLNRSTIYRISPSLGNKEVSFEKIEGLENTDVMHPDVPKDYIRGNKVQLRPKENIEKVSFYLKGNTGDSPDIVIDKNGVKIN